MNRTFKSPSRCHDTIQHMENGERIIGVKLTNSHKRCWLSLADYSNLIETYGLSAWFLNGNPNGHEYVRTTVAGRSNVVVARLMIDAPKGRSISYLDEDRTNLRRENLLLYSGKGNGPEAPQERRKRGRKGLHSEALHGSP